MASNYTTRPRPDRMVKRVENSSEVVQTIVRPHEATATATRQKRWSQAQLVAKYSGWVYKAATLNAMNCVQIPVRLFTTDRAVRKSYRTRSIDTKRQGWLRGDQGRLNPGRKVVQYADATNDDIEEVTEHPALELLDRGNEWMSGTAVQEFTHLCRELTGNAYLVPVFDNESEPVFLWPLRPHHTYVVPDRDGLIGGYVTGRSVDIEQFFDADEVMHHKSTMDPVDPYYGCSWLRAAAIEADLYTHSRLHQTSVMENGASPSMVVMLKGQVNKEKLQETREAVNAAHGGSTKSGKAFIFGAEDMNAMPMQFSAKDMEYLAGIENVRDTIMSLADIPKSIFTTDDVNLANAKSGENMYARNGLVPRMCRWVEDLNRFILPMFGVEDGEMWFAFDNPVPEDKEEIRLITDTRVRNGTMSRNEARRAFGDDPVDDESFDTPRSDQEITSDFGIGSFPFVEGDADGDAVPQLPEGESTATATADHQDTALNGAQAQALSEMVQRVIDNQAPAAVVFEEIRAAFPLIPEDSVRRMLDAAEAFEPSQAEPEEQTAQEATTPPTEDTREGEDVDRNKHLVELAGKAVADDAVQDLEEIDSAPTREDPTKRFVRLVASYMVMQRQAIVDAWLSGKITTPESFDLDAIPVRKALVELRTKREDLTQWDATLAEIVGTSTRDHVYNGVAQALVSATRLDAGVSFDVVNRGALKFLEDRENLLLRSASRVNKTTADRVKKEIAAGIAAGDDVQTVAKRITRKLDSIAPNRAVMIARTEIAHAQIGGRIAGLQEIEDELGVRFEKTWDLAPRPCEFCLAVDRQFAGKFIPIAEPFIKSGTTIQGAEGGTMTTKFDIMGAPLHPNCRCDVTEKRVKA